MPPRRRTVGVFMDYIGYVTGSYQTDLRAAFEIAGGRLGLDVLFIAGRALEPPPPDSAHYNSVYRLASPRNVDGIVLVSAGLATFCDVAGLERLCWSYAGLPLCSLGVRIPGVPSVTADNRPGFEELLEHVVKHHGCRKVAFIGGPPTNPDAVVRFETYQRVLAAHGLPLDLALVEHAHFTLHTGAQAMKSVVRRCPDVDAVVAANDGMALGAIQALRECGKRTPRDVLVTGFDDAAMGRSGDPPLTTVRQPLQAMVEAAMDLLLRQVEGEPVSEHVELPVEFVARSSCGCRLGSAWSRAGFSVSSPPPNPDGVGTVPPRTFVRTGTRVRPAASALVENLERALTVQVEDVFLAALEDLVTNAPPDQSVELMDALGEDLQTRERSLAGKALSATIAAAREFLQAAQLRAVLQRSRQFETAYHELRRVAERLSSVLERQALLEVLEAEAHCLGSRLVNVFLYPEGGPRELRPFFLWTSSAGSIACEHVNPNDLVAPEQRNTDDPRRLLVLPLVSENRDLGVLVLEPEYQQRDFERIPELLARTLINIALHQEVVKKTLLHERSVQERQATAERLKALGVLAGGVAHDLNNALGPLLALPEVMGEELDALPVAPDLTLELRADLAAIRSATARASRTIRDLVTLGRQGHTKRTPLDLNEVVRSSVGGPESPFARKHFRVRLELCPQPLMIDGSEAHLTRAIFNLVQNAVEACDGSGSVLVQTSHAVTETPRGGYETILPGDHALLTVSDTGSGIPVEIMPRIFEPFFTSKPVSETSGTGLGLALVHGVVKEHGGFIDVKSAPSEGTTFTLYFPRTEARAREPVERVTPVGGRGTILVIDDDPLQVRSACRVLSNLGYELTARTSGQVACELFESAHRAGKTSPFDLVITDVVLGEERDGLQICEQIRALFPGQRLLIVSGHAAAHRAAAASAHGIAWLIKPYTAQELGCAAEEALRSPPRETAPAPAARAALGT